MKKTNKIISLMLSAQMAATSVFAGPDFLQKQPNPKGGVTAPLDNKDKKSIDAKTIAKKPVLFPLKAWWRVTKPRSLGTGIFDLSLSVGYGVYEAYKWRGKNPILEELAKNYGSIGGILTRTLLSEDRTPTLCADMYYCLKRMGDTKVLPSSDTFSEYTKIAEKYSSLTDKFEIMEEFLSHFELINKYLIGTTERLAGLPNMPVYAYNREYCTFAFDKSFEIGGKDLKTIVGKIYRRCSLLIDPTKNLDNQERATEVQQKLNAWKETMYAILNKNNLQNFRHVI